MSIEPAAAWTEGGRRTAREHGHSTVVTLPKDAREASGIQADDDVRMYATEGAIVLTTEADPPLTHDDVADLKRVTDIGVLAQYVDWLTPSQQRDWIACRLGGRSYEDQSQLLDIGPDAVKYNVEKAEDRLASVHAEQSADE